MNFSNPYSRDLGVFTWAELQAAYPNGGGALAALPAGVTATVTNICKAVITVVPNAAKTRWIPQNGHAMLFNIGGDLATPLHTWAGATGKASIAGGGPTIAAGVLAAGDTLRNSIHLRKRNANATANWKVRFGTTGTYATDTVIRGDAIANVDNRQVSGLVELSFADTTSVFSSDWHPLNSQGTSTGLDQSTNINLASVMYIIAEISSINASDFVDLVMWRLEWFAQ